MGSQVFNIPRVAAENHPLVFKEVFTGNGVLTTFTLTGAVLNATFAIGAWDKARLILWDLGDVTKTTGKALYDSAIPFVRNRIAVSNINANGVVTLDHPPQAENFDIYYWYQPKESDRLSNYVRDDVISKVEESEPEIAAAIQVNTTAFGKNLSVADDTVQKALDTLDDMAGGGVTDHGALTGLSDDDHSQYILVAGTRPFTGDQALGTHKFTGLSVPVNAGDSIRATAKITEALLESATDLKHSNSLDHAAPPQLERIWFGA